MNNNVTISYSDYSNNSPVAEEIKFELAKDKLLTLRFNEVNNNVSITMADTISENTELNGILDLNKINVLIRSLSLFKNQINEKIT
jgi:hypothetical protein